MFWGSICYEDVHGKRMSVANVTLKFPKSVNSVHEVMDMFIRTKHDNKNKMFGV